MSRQPQQQPTFQSIYTHDWKFLRVNGTMSCPSALYNHAYIALELLELFKWEPVFAHGRCSSIVGRLHNPVINSTTTIAPNSSRVDPIARAQRNQLICLRQSASHRHSRRAPYPTHTAIAVSNGRALPPQPAHHASWEHAWLRHVQQIGMATFLFNWRQFCSAIVAHGHVSTIKVQLSSRLASFLP